MTEYFLVYYQTATYAEGNIRLKMILLISKFSPPMLPHANALPITPYASPKTKCREQVTADWRLADSQAGVI